MNVEAFIRGFLEELVKIGQVAPITAPTGENVMGASATMRLPMRPTTPANLTAARIPRPSIMPTPGGM